MDYLSTENQALLDDLTTLLMTELDTTLTTALVNTINTKLKKSEIARAVVYSDIQDKITAEIAKRINLNADLFSNKDLLAYMTSVLAILNKQDLESKEGPQIAILTNTINIGDQKLKPSLSKESRDRIASAIDNFLKQLALPEDIIDNEL